MPRVIANKLFDNIKQLFECTICSSSFETPIQVECGHIFCSNCIQTILNNNKRKPIACPLCKGKVTRRALKIRHDVVDLNIAVNGFLNTVESEDLLQVHSNKTRDKFAAMSKNNDIICPQESLIISQKIDQDEGLSSCSSQSSQPIDLRMSISESLRQSVFRNRPETGKPDNPLDFSIKKIQSVKTSIISKPQTFKSFKPYTEPRSNPLDDLAQIRGRKSLATDKVCPEAIIINCRNICPEKSSNLITPIASKTMLHKETQYSPQKIRKRILAEEIEEDEMEIPYQEEKRAKLSQIILDSDVVCVAEVERVCNGNEDTYFSEELDKVGNPGCTGIEFNREEDEHCSESDSEGSFLAPTPSKPTLKNAKAPLPTLTNQISQNSIPAVTVIQEENQIEENSKEIDLFEENEESEDNGIQEVPQQINSPEPDKYIEPDEVVLASFEDKPLVPIDLGRQPLDLFELDQENRIPKNLIVDSIQLSSPSKPRKFVFCPTRLTRSQLSKLNEVCKMCNGTISKEYTEEVSHLVINLEKDRVPQTMKYLFAVADKKWVVVSDWIDNCIKERCMVDEDPYETSSFPNCDKGARKSRTSSSTILDNIQFHFATPLKSTGAPIEDCKKLVEKMGGTVVNSAYIGYPSLMIIGDSLTTNSTYQNWYKTKGWISVTWEWILDCLLNYSIVPFSNGHLITNLEGSGWTNANLPQPVLDANN